jgi:hypothetical protein
MKPLPDLFGSAGETPALPGKPQNKEFDEF